MSEECRICNISGKGYYCHGEPEEGASSELNGLLSDREIELVNGMIEVQLNHAARCDTIANQKMAVKQKGWDMERVDLLKKVLRVMGR